MKRILSCSCLVLLSACKTTHLSTLHTVTVKPSALIGTAYDAVIQEFTGVSCLDVKALNADDYEMMSLSEFSVEEHDNASARDLEAALGAFQKSFYTTATGLRLSRPFETVQRILENRTEVVKLQLVQSERGALRFRPQSLPKLRLSAEAQKLVQQIIMAQGEERSRLVDAFIQTCGTGFLAGTHYKLSMVAVLRWIFKNAEEKQRWGSDVRSMEVEAWAESKRSWPAMRLRYESYMKETRLIPMKAIGGVGSKDCAPEAHVPCLDAWRLFVNASVPTWQKLVKRFADDFDAVLPQAYLFDPEVISYQDVEPALAGIALEPDAREAEAWREARMRFVELYARVFREMQGLERRGEMNQVIELQPLLQQISTEAAPCYRPILKRELCLLNADRLQAEVDRRWKP